MQLRDRTGWLMDEFDEIDTTEADFDRAWAEGEPVELREA
jgi:hypothetical protein